MAKQIESIDWLITRLKKLSKNPAKNADEIERIEKTIVEQAEFINNLDVAKMIERMVEEDISKEEYDQYLVAMREIKKYTTHSEKIYELVEKNNKNNKNRKRRITSFIIGSTLMLGLNGCSVNNTKSVEENTYTVKTVKINTDVITEVPTEKITEIVTEKITEAPTVATTEKRTEVITEAPTTEVITEAQTEEVTEANTPKYSEAEQSTVVETFKEMKDNVVDLYNSEGATKARKVAKEYVTNAIDFIFFNASINGITFSDMKQEFKEDIYNYLQTMDGIIMKFDPDYKESLGDKYNAVKDFSKKKIEQAKELIIDKIGQEKYDSIIAKKNEIIDKITSGLKKYGGKALQFIKDKYLEWKED